MLRMREPLAFSRKNLNVNTSVIRESSLGCMVSAKNDHDVSASVTFGDAFGKAALIYYRSFLLCPSWMRAMEKRQDRTSSCNHHDGPVCGQDPRDRRDSKLEKDDRKPAVPYSIAAWTAGSELVVHFEDGYLESFILWRCLVRLIFQATLARLKVSIQATDNPGLVRPHVSTIRRYRLDGHICSQHNATVFNSQSSTDTFGHEG